METNSSSNPENQILVGVDIGGTFTDVFAYDPRSQQWTVAKTPSTPPVFVDGTVRGLEEAVSQFGNGSAGIGRVAHGTTIAANALLEHRGAKLGFLMTEGFEDTLIVGIGKRRDMYDLMMDPVEPLFLAPRRRMLGVTERMDAQGKVVKPLDEDSVQRAAEVLVDEFGCEALVICFLHSYVNATHETHAGEIVARLYPNVPVSLSSEVLPMNREYKRLLVSAFDAYVAPVLRTYLTRLDQAIQQKFDLTSGSLQIMQSNGGLAGVRNVASRPVRTVLSGPVAGVIGAGWIAERSGISNCITLDMGGTSTDICLIRDGQPAFAPEGDFAGYPLSFPILDVRAIGAGGGSVAHVDTGGALKVGPQSTGSSPGPACYGRGGTLPTVTDADLLLGFLGDKSFAGGIHLRPDLSTRAIQEGVATELGLTPREAAMGIRTVVTASIANAVRLLTVVRGHDPADFALVAFGGAGPVRAGDVAEQLGINTVIIPPTPGITSAMGLLLAKTQHDFGRTFLASVSSLDIDDLRHVLGDIDAVCASRLDADGIPAEGRQAQRYAELRYQGQTHGIEIEIPHELGPRVPQQLSERFHDAHHRIHHHARYDEPTEIVTVRAIHTYAWPELVQDWAGPEGEHPAMREGLATPTRVASFDGKTTVDLPVYSRAALPVDSELEGPAAISQMDSTTIVYPGQTARVDETGSLILTRTTSS